MTFSPAAERNKAPILDGADAVLPGPRSGARDRERNRPARRALRRRAPDWDWQPSEADRDALASIASRTAALAECPAAADAGRSRAALARVARSLRRRVLRQHAAHPPWRPARR